MSLISITRMSGQEFAIQIRGHKVTSDMSEGDGGQDQGPSPSELLVGALGACIAMMVQLYCDQHGYGDGVVSASVAYELADGPKLVGAITIDLEIPCDVPEDRMDAIRRIAKARPVHGTFDVPPIVDVEILSG